MPHDVAERMGNAVDVTFACAGDVVQRWGGRVELHDVKLGGVSASHLLASSKVGVFVDRLVQKQLLDHCIVVSGVRGGVLMARNNICCAWCRDRCRCAGVTLQKKWRLRR